MGNRWIGTLNGLYLLAAQSKKAKLLAYNPYNKNSLISPLATAVYNFDDHTLILGTLQGLSIYDRLNKTFKNINLPFYNGKNYNNNINAIASGKNGSFWVGTWEGLFRIDKNTGSIQESFVPATGQKMSDSTHQKTIKHPIYQLFKDKKGMLWIADQGKNLVRMNDNNVPRVFESIPVLVANEGPKINFPRCFAEYADRYVLIGTENGIVQYDYADNSYRRLPIAFENEQGDIQIDDLSWSTLGFLLVVANTKPYKIDLKQQTATLLVSPQNIKRCYRIIEDTEGGVWFNTESGVARTDMSGKSYSFFDSKNYLSNNTFQLSNEFRIDKDSIGNLYFGGSKGFTVINPREMLATIAPPTVKITSIKYNNQPIDLQQVIYASSAISLPYSQRNFTLEFAALGSEMPQRNHFAYRLNGGDWVDLGNENTVNFSNLEPNTYTLQVKAANSDGVWNEEGVKLSIAICPPWYRSRLAWLVYLMAIGYVIYYYYQYQLRRQLEHAETVRLKELDEFKTRFFTNITHEFRTPLTVILGMASQIEDSAAVANAGLKNKLRLIKGNGENLLRLINQILDLAQLDTQTLRLKYIQGDVVVYLNYVSESLHSFANAHNVMVKVVCPERTIVMDYEPEYLRQITYNLLSNAIKFTPSGGQIHVHIDTQTAVLGKKTLTLRFEDTGTGIPKADLPYIFDRFFQSNNAKDIQTKGTGIGLSLTKELVKAMEGDITVQSNEQGTVFTVTLPITNNALSSETAWQPVSETYEKTNLIKPNNQNASDEEKPLLLIIEDNADVVDYITACLQADYQLDFAYNGRAGIEKAFEILPDIILSDVMMPEKSGLDVLETLKNDERTSHIPIVLLTAKATVADRIKGLRTGADAYLVKPFYPEELSVILSKLVTLRKALQAKYAQWVLTNEKEKPNAPTDTPIEDAFLQKLRAVVEKHIADTDFEMPQLERALGMSRSQIFRKVKALTGSSPSLFIRTIRLQQGKHLLETSTLTVSEIAYDSGFSSVQYFSDAFLEAFQVRPSEWRK